MDLARATEYDLFFDALTTPLNIAATYIAVSITVVAAIYAIRFTARLVKSHYRGEEISDTC